MPQTLLDKIWEAHEVAPGLLYIDLHLVHEVTSPQAFDGLRLAGRARAPARPHARDGRPQRADRRHDPAPRAITDELSRVQVADARAQLRRVRRSRSTRSAPTRQGIVHVIGPELGVTQPGHDDRLRRLAHRDPRRLRRARVRHRHERGRARAGDAVPGPAASPARCGSATRARLGFGVTAKDLILATIGQIGVDGAVGHVVEYAGPAIAALSMEGRMTVCNMTIEGGGRAGMVAPDETTFAWFERHRSGPARRSGAELDEAIERWRALRSDDGASFDREVVVDAAAISPQVTWGTNPGMVVGVAGRVPAPDEFDGAADRDAAERALHYMGLERRHADRGDPPRPRLHRLVHELADRRPARRRRGRPRAPRRRRRPARWSCPGSAAGQARRPRPRASTRSSARPASTGAAPAARCAWA